MLVGDNARLFKDGMDKDDLLNFCRSYSQRLMLSPLKSASLVKQDVGREQWCI